MPESFYMSVDGDELDHMSVAHVAHGEKLRLQFAVKDPGAILRCEINTSVFIIRRRKWKRVLRGVALAKVRFTIFSR